MARFVFTMNMPSKGGNIVHQVIGDHDCSSVEEMCDHLNSNDFILIREFYRDGPDSAHGRFVGEVCINTMMVGKVKIDNKPTQY
jgi:hypothetical protein